MTWSINATGTKQEAIDQVTANAGPSEGSHDVDQFARAKAHVLAELADAPEAAVCSVSGSGHRGASGESYQSLSLSAK